MNPTVGLTMARNDSVSILVAGKVGTGKSSLINSVNGCDVATEGEAQTTQLKSYPMQVETIANNVRTQIRVTFWDSPGIGSLYRDEDALYTQLAAKYKEVDLLFYCLDMRQRLSKDDVNGITRLTEALGPELWKNAVFVLTFANEVKPPPGSYPDQATQHFKDTLHSWKDAIGRLLGERLSVPEEIIRDIAIIPAGYHQQAPPDRRDWFTPFWREACHRFKESAHHLIYGINLAEARVVLPLREDRLPITRREDRLPITRRSVMIIVVCIVVGALLGMWLVENRKGAEKITGEIAEETTGETTGEPGPGETGPGTLWTGLVIGMLVGGLVGLILNLVDRHYSTINATMKKRC